MKRILTVIAILAVVSAATWYAFGTGQGATSTRFGGGADGTITLIGDIKAAPDTFLGKVVTVEGNITTECPSTGCWWYLKDATGEIRADSFGTGFALPLHREGRPIRTTGKVMKTEFGELQLTATGAEFR